jgi:hypothetical protein
LDPGLDWARAGIVESLKAKNIIYRGMLGYFFWMSRLKGRVQWAVILGLAVLYQIADSVEAAHPKLVVVTRPLIVAYLVFFVLTWLARPLFNSLLRLNRFGRMVLNSEEALQSTLVCLLLLPALPAGVFYLFNSNSFVGICAEEIALAFGFSAIGVSTVFHCSRGWPRWSMLALTTVFIGASAKLLWLWYQSYLGDGRFSLYVLTDARSWKFNVARPLAGVLLIGGNILVSIRPRR